MSSESRFSWLKQQRELLQLEADEEREETSELLRTSRQADLASAGVALLKLYLTSNNGQLSTGLYGKLSGTFTRYSSEDLLPAHRLSSGDIVGIFDSILFLSCPTIFFDWVYAIGHDSC